MKYEIVTQKEKIVVGISARTNNLSPDMEDVIGGLWKRFYHDGVYASIPGKTDEKALGIYTDYAGNEKADYTVMVACETSVEPQGGAYTVRRIPAGRYAKFVVQGNMVQAVAKTWQKIWQMNLPRAFQYDFEEYQDERTEDAEIHIYVGLKEEKENMVESRCGLLCGECGYREQMNCIGCISMEKPFWGERCPVKACCETRLHEHCGQCKKFPCDLLHQFAYDEKQGDSGQRIVQCQCWRER